MAAATALGEIVELALEHEHEAVVLALEEHVGGAELEALGDAFDLRAVLEEKDREVDVGLADPGDELCRVVLHLGILAAHEQIPALLGQDLVEHIEGVQVLGAGRVACIPEFADQLLGHVLGRVRDDQVQRFGLLHVGVGSFP